MIEKLKNALDNVLLFVLMSFIWLVSKSPEWLVNFVEKE
jgi:hypothetical protein